jgi:hypothetical protein
MLMSFIGAGVPHSVPSRMGASGTTTASRPFSKRSQRGVPAQSCADRVRKIRPGLGLAGQQPRKLAVLPAVRAADGDCGPAAARPASIGAAFCANAPGAASTQNAAATAQRLPVIKN